MKLGFHGVNMICSSLYLIGLILLIKDENKSWLCLFISLPYFYFAVSADVAASVDISSYYEDLDDDAFADGAASVDITSDNADVADDAYADCDC